MKQSAVFLIFCLACAFIALPSGAIQLTTELAASGFSNPVFLTSPPGDISRMFIVEQHTGKIRIIKNGAVLPIPFLDVGTLLSPGGEQGLLGMAFHPRYARNGFFYINYTDVNGDTRVMRYKVSSNPDVADPNSAYQVLFVDQPVANHNGGMLVFGPDGYLYIGLGDGGGSPGNRSQDLALDLGKILRIRPRKNQPYSIPPDNPFVNTPGANPRVYSRGWRNPWRFSFDAATGDMWIADVGQSRLEELDFKPASSAGGENYGWPLTEGTLCFTQPGSDCSSLPGLTYPVYQYGRTEGASITGGYVYRGPIRDLRGTYFFGDYIRARIWSMRYDGATILEFQERTAELDPPGVLNIRGISSFAEDAEHNLYVLDWTHGEVFKIVEVGGMPVDSRYWMGAMGIAIAAVGVIRIAGRQRSKRRMGSMRSMGVMGSMGK